MSDAPTSYSGLSDSLWNAAVKIFDSTWLTKIKTLRYLFEKTMHLPAGSTQQNYGHAHCELNQDGNPPDGVTIRRSLCTISFASGSYDYRRHSLAATTWTEIARWPCCIGAARRIATEVRSEVDTGNVRYRISRWDWNDSAAESDDGGGTGTQYVQESSGVSPASPTNHTIDGVSYTSDGVGGYTTNNGGAATKFLYLDGPTSKSDFDEMCSRAWMILEAYASASQDHDLYNVHQFEVLTTDEDGTSDAWLD